MKNHYLLRIALGLALLLVAPQLWAQDYSFYLFPSNDISGPPGSTIGWGYYIVNSNPTDWLAPENLSSDPFEYGTANNIFDFPDIAPSSYAIEGFDPIAQTGLYELTWYNSAPVDFANYGTFVLSADWYSGDPGNGGIDLGPAGDEYALYTASVTAVVPEPAILALLLTGLIGIGALRKSITA